ncbi:MAG TPA: hypothetical protein VHP33_13385 [Polyangiaceae bacterium]|nr:hypothetical protein [Polyangiaceae bacterium]
MRTCEYAGEPFAAPRSHPWLGAASDKTSRYYDLTASPALIRSSLEDFLPWARYAAVDAFYVLLERVNHEKSLLESNDCAFTGPHPSKSTSSQKALECSGRVMVLFRDLTRNTVDGQIEALKNDLHFALGKLDPNFRSGVVGTTIVPVRYLALSAANDEHLGVQLMISFWAWGNSEQETMQNLSRLLRNLVSALRKLCSPVAA